MHFNECLSGQIDYDAEGGPVKLVTRRGRFGARLAVETRQDSVGLRGHLAALPEHGGEMTLVREADGLRDIGQLAAGRAKQVFGPFDSTLEQELVR